MSWCAAYNCSNCIKNNHEEIFFTFSKNDCTRKVWIAAINQKGSTLPKNVLFCVPIILKLVK